MLGPTYGCSTVVLIGFTCPAITVVTVILRALDRVRERVLGLLCLSITQIPARQASRGVPDLPPGPVNQHHRLFPNQHFLVWGFVGLKYTR